MMRILVVDDDPGVLRAVARQLRLHGHTVMCAEGVQAARRTAGQMAALHERFDFVVTDIDMPDGSGFDLIDQLKRDLKHPPEALFMSGIASTERLDRAAKYATILISKGPNLAQDILHFINRHNGANNGAGGA